MHKPHTISKIIRGISRRLWPRHALSTLFGLLFLTLLSTPVPGQTAQFDSWTTQNGMRVLFAPAPALPMLDIRLLFDAGAVRDADLPGLARLTSQGLAFGTSEMDADAVAETFDSVGARFSSNAGLDSAHISLRSLTQPDWLDTALEMLTSLLRDPAFPQSDLDRGRRQALLALRQEGQEPGAIGMRRFFELAYGDHPYANHTLGSEESLKTITRRDLRQFFDTYYVQANAVLAMTGDISLEHAQNIATRIAEALPPGRAAQPLPPVSGPTESIREHLPFPSEQAHIFMGAPALKQSDPARYPLKVANHAFGGGSLTSRLFQEIRSRRGLAYSVSSHFRPMKAQGPFLISMQTGISQVEEALEVLDKELRQFISEKLTPEELQASKDNIIGGFPLGLASNSGIVSALAGIGYHGLPEDYLATYTGRIEQVTLDTALAAVREHLHPERMVTVIVGGQ